MTLSISNIRDMLADDQEDLVKAYIGMFSCVATQEDGSVKELNPDMVLIKLISTQALQQAGFNSVFCVNANNIPQKPHFLG